MLRLGSAIDALASNQSQTATWLSRSASRTK